MVFVLTDGRSNIGIGPGIPAGQLKKAGVVMFAMGVTGNIKDSELLSIATSPKHVFHLVNFAALKHVIHIIEGGELLHNIVVCI